MIIHNIFFTLLLSLILITAQKLQAAPNPDAPQTEPTNQAQNNPKPSAAAHIGVLPAAIQRMIDQHQAQILSQGQIADLSYYVMQAQGQIRTFLTSAEGTLISGRVYHPDGKLLFDTEANQTSAVPTSPSTTQTQINNKQQDRLLIQQAITTAQGPQGASAAWADLAHATAIAEGSTDAPLLYVFIDVYCPYCHQQWQLLREAIAQNRYHVRWVPVAVLDASKRDIGAVLGLLQNPDATHLAQWMDSKLIARADSNETKLALIRNNVLFKRLNATQVPSVLYQQADGQIVLRSGLLKL